MQQCGCSQIGRVVSTPTAYAGARPFQAQCLGLSTARGHTMGPCFSSAGMSTSKLGHWLKASLTAAAADSSWPERSPSACACACHPQPALSV